MMCETLVLQSAGTSGKVCGVRSGLLVALATLVVVPLDAQTASANKPEDETVQLPALQVTATLRNEPLLSVPIAIAVVSGEQMMLASQLRLSEVTTQMPSLTFRSGGSNKDTSLLIRGVGTITTSPGVEPGVSTVIDGVVLARPGQSTMDLTDVDHVEVLRGPQGTLFGKNASVGVVNVVSKEPSERREGYLDATYFGGGNQQIYRGGISGAVIPQKLRVALSGLYDKYDGNVENIVLKQTVNGHENWGARAKAVYTPTADFKATFVATYLKTFFTTPNNGPFARASNTAFPSGTVTPGSPLVLAAIAPIALGPDNMQVASGLWGRIYDFNNGLSGQLEWSMGPYKLTSISAYQNWYNNQYEDTNIAPQPMVGATLAWDDGHLWFDQYSQELRVTSPTGRFFDFVAGAYFQHTIGTETYRRDIAQMPTAGTIVRNYGEAHYGTHSNNYSAYGEGTWNLSPQLRAITGLRVTRDTLTFYHQRVTSSAVAVPGINPTHPIHSGDTDANGISGRAGLQYDLSKGVMVYGTYSRGYKGPAYNVFFNQSPLQVAPLDPEKSDAYELGLKSLTLNNRLQVTAAAFRTVYHDYQANFQTLVVGTPVTNLINAGQVSSKGVELDATARLTSQLTMSASFSRVNAVVDHFNTPPGAVRIDGQPLPFSPRFKTNIEATYRIPISKELKGVLTTNYAYQTKQQFSLSQTPDTIQGDYGIWNAAFAVSNSADGWRLTLHAKNIADTQYSTLLTQSSGFVWRIVPRDAQRYLGVSLHKDF